MSQASRSTLSRSILSRTTGFIARAGFSHSLTPARNCTFGCTYCYVPTMRIYGGLKPEDWNHWGQFTTFKTNAPDLLARELRPTQSIYCSPLTDPYQPAEAAEELMPSILDAVMNRPPAVFTIQTRGPLILRDIQRLVQLSTLTSLRVSFSLTTDREDIRRWYEPHCATFAERLSVIRTLRDAGIRTHATLAPLLPCNIEVLAGEAIAATTEDLVGDPLHVRSVKAQGATTRDAAFRISEHHRHNEWFDPVFQAGIVERIEAITAAHGRRFGVGEEGFSWLSKRF